MRPVQNMVNGLFVSILVIFSQQAIEEKTYLYRRLYLLSIVILWATLYSGHFQYSMYWLLYSLSVTNSLCALQPLACLIGSMICVLRKDPINYLKIT